MDATEVFGLIPNILNYSPPEYEYLGNIPHINIFIFGHMGAGKSCLISTLYSALSDKVRMVAVSRPVSGKSLTSEFFTRPITNKIRVSDTWGWSNTNYDNREFEYILKGRLKHGYNYTGQNIEMFLRAEKVNTQHEIHCIIFLIPLKSWNNEEYLLKLTQFIEKAENLKYRYIVAVTQIDQFFPELGEYPQRLPVHKELQVILNKLADRISVQQNIIFPVINYTKDQEKVECIDILALRILNKALNVAHEFLLDRDINLKLSKEN